jgi:hypothetical protein
MASEELPKKKGRRKKEPIEKKPIKKKITKIITSMNKIECTQNIKSSNVILQLSCSLKEIEDYSINHIWTSNNFSYNPSVPTEIQAYDHQSLYFGEYQSQEISQPELLEIDSIPVKYAYSNICSKCNETIYTKNKEDDSGNAILKLKQLKIQLYNNIIPDKNADCFWCTYPFDNSPCYVLQHGSKNEIFVINQCDYW